LGSIESLGFVWRWLGTVQSPIGGRKLPGFGLICRASKTFLLVEKCLERVYRGAVLAAAGSNPETPA
jgi:hypothetical protein